MSAIGFDNFQLSFCEGKSKMKFLHASMKSLTNCEIPSRNRLQGACSSFLLAVCAFKKLFRNPLVILKIVPKAGYECTLEKIYQ
jgi:hypothetical protein